MFHKLFSYCFIHSYLIRLDVFKSYLERGKPLLTLYLDSWGMYVEAARVFSFQSEHLIFQMLLLKLINLSRIRFLQFILVKFSDISTPFSNSLWLLFKTLLYVSHELNCGNCHSGYLRIERLCPEPPLIHPGNRKNPTHLCKSCLFDNCTAFSSNNNSIWFRDYYIVFLRFPVCNFDNLYAPNLMHICLHVSRS